MKRLVYLCATVIGISALWTGIAVGRPRGGEPDEESQGESDHNLHEPPHPPPPRWPLPRIVQPPLRNVRLGARVEARCDAGREPGVPCFGCFMKTRRHLSPPQNRCEAS